MALANSVRTLLGDDVIANPLAPRDFSSYDPAKIGGAGFGIDDYDYLLKQGATRDQIAQIAQQASGIGPKAQAALSGIPAPPTMDTVFSDWNKLHFEKFGTYVDLRTASPEDIQAQVQRLQPELQRQQQDWFAKYGETPEAQALAQEPPPTWQQIYSEWEPQHIKQFGQIVDRPWYQDADATRQKQELDTKYINALNDYNQRYGTNFQPNTSVLGPTAQPSIFVRPQEDDDDFFKDVVVPVAALAASFYAPQIGLAVGAPASAAGAVGGGLIGGTSALLTDRNPLTGAAIGALGGQFMGGAEGTGAFDIAGNPDILGGSSSIALGNTLPSLGNGAFDIGGNPDILAPTQAAPIVTATPIPANELAFPAVEVGQNATPVPGSLRETLSELGVQQAAPMTAVPGSFQAALPELLAPTAAAGLSVTDTLRQAQQAFKLLGGEQPQQPTQELPRGTGLGQRTAVDYSGLLNLLASRTTTPNISNLLAPAELMPQYNPYSLLG